MVLGLAVQPHSRSETAEFVRNAGLTTTTSSPLFSSMGSLKLTKDANDRLDKILANSENKND